MAINGHRKLSIADIDTAIKNLQNLKHAMEAVGGNALVFELPEEPEPKSTEKRNPPGKHWVEAHYKTIKGKKCFTPGHWRGGWAGRRAKNKSSELPASNT